MNRSKALLEPGSQDLATSELNEYRGVCSEAAKCTLMDAIPYRLFPEQQFRLSLPPIPSKKQCLYGAVAGFSLGLLGLPDSLPII
jgi:hypothetical protein